MHYRIRQNADSGRWIITSAADQDMIWSGGHRSYSDQRGAHPISFPNAASAMAYAEEVFRSQEKPK